MRDIDQTGIYQIRNLTTGKVYIGSTANKLGFKERWRTHRNKLYKNKHCNQYLQRAWNKYGKEDFVFEILKICPKEECIKNEQFYLDKIKPYNSGIGYNLCKKAGNTLGRKHSKETRAKIGKNRTYGAPWNKGKTTDVSVKKTQSQSQKTSKLCVENLKKLNKSKRKPVTGICVRTGETIKLEYMHQDKRFHGSGIRACILGKIKQYKGYVWKYTT